MNPPAGIDMSLIRDAMARRAAGGGGTPPIQQVSIPQGSMPGGGSTSPLQTPNLQQPTGPLLPPQQPQAPAPAMPGDGAPQGMPQAVNPQQVLAQLQAQGGQSSGAAGPGQPQSGGGFDDKTKSTAKALMNHLLKVL